MCALDAVNSHPRPRYEESQQAGDVSLMPVCLPMALDCGEAEAISVRRLLMAALTDDITGHAKSAESKFGSARTVRY
jgi:hypothetical protein